MNETCVDLYTDAYSGRSVHVSYMYHNLSKIGPPSKISPPPFLNKVVAKGPFLLKVLPPIYAVVHAFRASKKHQRSSSV